MRDDCRAYVEIRTESADVIECGWSHEPSDRLARANLTISSMTAGLRNVARRLERLRSWRTPPCSCWQVRRRGDTRRSPSSLRSLGLGKSPAPLPIGSGAGDFPTQVTVEKMANGVYRLGGGPANSYMVEFANFVAVFEAPGDQSRSLAVIEEIVKLAPGKPIRWLISSHPHFDHIGGLGRHLHIGATIVTHMANLEFLNTDVLSYEPRTVKPDIVARWPPTELSEGYNYEAVQENYVITDNSRILRGLLRAASRARRRHVNGLSACRADRISGGSLRHARAAKGCAIACDADLMNQVQRMKLDVVTLAPVHGQPVPWSAFQAALKALSATP